MIWKIISVRESAVPGKNYAEPLFSLTAVSGSRVLKLDKLTKASVDSIDLEQAWARS